MWIGRIAFTEVWSQCETRSGKTALWLHCILPALTGGQQDKAHTDKSHYIQHETSALETEDLIIFIFKPTSCSSAAGSVTCAHHSLFDMLPLHLFFPLVGFL